MFSWRYTLPMQTSAPPMVKAFLSRAGARRSLQRPRWLAAQEDAGRPRLDSQPGTEEGEITEKKTIAMRRSEALPNRNELPVN
jgi:hypothetical protein